MGSIVSSVMLGSCSKKDDDDPNPKPDYSQPSGEFKDSRDGKIYKWVRIGDQIWMAENLAYTGSGQLITDNNDWENTAFEGTFDGWCYYDNDENNGTAYGILYQWEAAKSGCPSGWHLPTDAEWTALEQFVGNDGHAGTEGSALKATTGWFNNNSGTDDYGFSALPGGYRTGTSQFEKLTSSGYWWTGSEYDNNHAYIRELTSTNEVVYRSYLLKSFGLSVRCIKD